MIPVGSWLDTLTPSSVCLCSQRGMLFGNRWSCRVQAAAQASDTYRASHKLTALLCLQLLHQHASPQHKPQDLAREAATLASAKHSNILQYLVSL